MFWPNMSGEPKDHITMCSTLGVNHNVPDHPWAKIATDHFDFENKSYLVTVYFFSGFYEIDRIYDSGNASIIRKI